MKEIVDAIGMSRSITRIAHEIIEKNKGTDNIVLVGIKTRGEFLAKRLADKISLFEEVSIPYCGIDINFWRDDEKKKVGDIPTIDIDLQGKIVILVDDVLFSGRTIRAAMDGIMNYARPAEIHLAVLVDRGHRELPIRADYVGKNLPTSKKEIVSVKMAEIDEVDSICIE
ncbi:bifunctional pyr operon transcriptional regulator/uracil phosphoribosyltransferase PyrR [Anaerorhabdus sp.]|jgi:pyrimidine operon attenuation protein / uracil phosphoribosyltransferase|uniref:bifunctional pyr operon transcriptional regulator/uracil phosphoribosyltransferase PyrR n=1 Tax=Anaerorhabdus sp. TaxID=1872524 RepID=UPI002FC74C68